MSKVKIFIVISSLYGHVYKLAQAIKEGLEKNENVEVKLFQVAETLPEEVLQKMHAQKFDLPILDPRGEEIKTADGFLFGIPTRYGLMSGQLKQFFDGCGGLFSTGGLVGKIAGTFFSTSTQHGGQETTALTTVTHFAHLGMIYVPLGYTHPNLFINTEVIGGSPYGAGTITSSDGSRQPSDKELEIARHQGEQFAKYVVKFRGE